MKDKKIGRKLGALALTGIIASATFIPCAVNAVDTDEKESAKVVSSGEVTTKKEKKQHVKPGKKMKFAKCTSGDTSQNAKQKVQFKNLTDEEKEALKAKRKEKKTKFEDLTDEEKEALKAKIGEKMPNDKMIKRHPRGKKLSEKVTE